MSTYYLVTHVQHCVQQNTELHDQDDYYEDQGHPGVR